MYYIVTQHIKVSLSVEYLMIGTGKSVVAVHHHSSLLGQPYMIMSIILLVLLLFMLNTLVTLVCEENLSDWI